MKAKARMGGHVDVCVIVQGTVGRTRAGGVCTSDQNENKGGLCMCTSGEAAGRIIRARQ